jgi:putative cardiolipin synthase
MRKLIAASLILFPLLASAINHSDSIPYPFYSEDASGETQMMPLHRGEEALQLRLELIRKAQKSIDVEYYIYYKDMTGKIFNRELIKAAQRGVKVRILVDNFASGVDSYLAHELTEAGIEIKFYNTKAVLRFDAINYRNHRKLFVIDDAEAITGGRNMADDYFNLDPEYNYEDRDVYVKGPIVTAMKDSFEAFWNHEISHYVKRPARPRIRINSYGEREGASSLKRWEKKVKETKEFLEETEASLAVRAELEQAATAQLEDNKIYPCPVATFVTDAPGRKGKLSQSEYLETHRNVRKTFLDKILPIDKAITLSSPYFIPNERNEYIFEELLEKGVEFNLYSNSLRSTDALFMSANLYLKLKGFLKKGMKVFFNDGDWAHMDDAAVNTAKTSKWGTHAKTHVYETSTYSEIMIGTYNIDNRSDYYNTELALFCKGNDDLTQDVKADIMKLANRGLRVESMTKAVDRTGAKINITGASPIKRLKMKLLTIPSWLISHLL